MEGTLIPTIIISIKDCWYKGEHPKVSSRSLSLVTFKGSLEALILLHL